MAVRPRIVDGSARNGRVGGPLELQGGEGVLLSEQGWLRLANEVASKAERRYCLAQALSINRRNALARRELEALGAGAARPPLSGAAEAVPPRRRSSLDIVRVIRNYPVQAVVFYLMAVTVTEFLTLVIAPQIGLWGP